MTIGTVDNATTRVRRAKAGLLGRFRHSRDGTAAIEFAILAIPFFMLVFATIEAFIAFAGEQLLANAVDTMARKLRTGQITDVASDPTYKSQAQFRAAFCQEIALMMTCDAETDRDRSNLNLDVRSFTTFADIPKGIPRKDGLPDGDLDTTNFAYDPGGPGSINMVRAYYRWGVTTDLVRPYITNVRASDGSSPDYYLMVATAAFQNENYP